MSNDVYFVKTGYGPFTTATVRLCKIKEYYDDCGDCLIKADGNMLVIDDLETDHPKTGKRYKFEVQCRNDEECKRLYMYLVGA